jgi:hypothetical protein
MTKKCHLDEQPFKWRRENLNLYPEVSILAKNYMSIITTNIPCECMFSEAHTITSKTRNKLFSS